MTDKKKVTRVDRGRYVRIEGEPRKWRASKPMPEAKRQALVDELMDARRAVGAALRAKDIVAEEKARKRVDKAKRALGERGERW